MNIKVVVRPGVSEKFPSISKYLKGYALGPVTWESDEFVSLRRYAEEGRYQYPSTHDGEMRTFTFVAAETALACVAAGLRWLSTQAALKQEAGFEELLAKGAAYRYWAIRAQHRFDKFRFHDFKTGGRPQYLPMMSFRDSVSCLAEVFLLGWRDLAVALNRSILLALSNGAYFDADDVSRPRAQFFVLQLLSAHFGLSFRTSAAWATGEPIYAVLSDSWDVADPSDVTPELLAALDRHTHQSVRPKRNGPDFDFKADADWYFPYEVLVVLKLRELAGLANPAIEVLAHPLTSTPLGRLMPPVPIYTDDVLEGVVQRLREEYPDV